MKKNTLLYIICFLFLCCILTCGKKWKETTTVNFTFEINKGNNGYLQFDDGNIILKEMNFSGNRKQGKKEVDFNRSYEGQSSQMKITFSSGTNPTINFDIPQGTYNSIDIVVKTLKQQQQGNEKSLSLTGTYLKDNGDEIPIRLEFIHEISFTIKSQSENGSSEIVLVEDKPTTANIIFDPIYWFDAVPKSMLENAQTKNMQGTPTIVINNVFNESIFNIVLDRITNGNKAIFKTN